MLTFQACCDHETASLRRSDSSTEVQVERPAPGSCTRLQHCVLFLLSDKKLAYRRDGESNRLNLGHLRPEVLAPPHVIEFEVAPHLR
jgi:hypothetical protein